MLWLGFVAACPTAPEGAPEALPQVTVDEVTTVCWWSNDFGEDYFVGFDIELSLTGADEATHPEVRLALIDHDPEPSVIAARWTANWATGSELYYEGDFVERLPRYVCPEPGGDGRICPYNGRTRCGLELRLTARDRQETRIELRSDPDADVWRQVEP